MQTTTNYGYNLVESTDTCNVPVQISPNFSDIDTDLKAVSDAALTSAIDTFASNVHALVRDDADRNLLFFIAPADYVAGDTFTVDGLAVSATDVAGNALESNAFRVNSAVIGLIYGSRLTLNVVNPVTIPTPDAGDIPYDNTISGLTATDVQAAIDEIVANIPTSFAASAITYDNTVSGLAATDVQAAIDELAATSGEVSIVTSGSQTFAQAYNLLFSMADISKINTNSKIVHGTGIFALQNITNLAFSNIDVSSTHTFVNTITLSNASTYVTVALSTSPNYSRTDYSNVNAPAGMTLKLVY